MVLLQFYYSKKFPVHFLLNVLIGNSTFFQCIGPSQTLSHSVWVRSSYVTPPVISFESVFEQSTPFSPIVFILSPGTDPSGDLGKLGERMGYGGDWLKFLAMGQGQEKVYLTTCS